MSFITWNKISETKHSITWFDSMRQESQSQKHKIKSKFDFDFYYTYVFKSKSKVVIEQLQWMNHQTSSWNSITSRSPSSFPTSEPSITISLSRHLFPFTKSCSLNRSTIHLLTQNSSRKVSESQYPFCILILLLLSRNFKFYDFWFGVFDLCAPSPLICYEFVIWGFWFMFSFTFDLVCLHVCLLVMCQDQVKFICDLFIFFIYHTFN